MILPVLAALLGVMAFSPFAHLYWVGFVFLIPLFIFYSRERSFGRLLIGSLLFRFLLGLGTVYYAMEPIAWVWSLATFLPIPIAVFMARKINEKIGYRFDTARGTLAALTIMPFIWTVGDLLSVHFSLLPIYVISTGNILGSSGFVGIAAYGGVATLTFFIATVNALFAAVMLKRKRPSRFITGSAIACIALVMGLVHQLSTVTLAAQGRAYATRSHTIQIEAFSLSAHVPQDRYAQLLDNGSEHAHIDLAFFPEGFFDKANHDPYGAKEELTATMTAALPGGTSLGAGAFDYRTAESRHTYVATVVAGHGESPSELHYKYRLSFIGEYWPFGSWHPFFYDWFKNADTERYAIFNKGNGYAVGQRSVLRSTIDGTDASFGILACMEGQYPYDVAWYRTNGAKFIANLTSNRWATSGKVHVLFLMNNLRRIEAVQSDIPVVISGIEDIGGVFYPDGKKSAVYYGAGTNGYAIFRGEIRM